ncbi:MAG: SprT family zinc-dependent metalloprotease [Pseudomonadota bacterium]
MSRSAFSKANEALRTGLFGAGHDAPDQMVIVLDEPGIEVSVRVNRRARRFTLRLSADGRGAVLTVPPEVPMPAARHFVESHRGWLASALARQPEIVALDDGVSLPVDGKPVVIRLDPRATRTPRLSRDALSMAPGPDVGRRLTAFLKARARDQMAPAVHRCAEQLGKRCTAIAFRDTRSRWGSCSSSGRVGLSWRLTMAPPEIQAYVAAHEAAHLVEMNHSPRYWAVLSSLMPDYEVHRTWLRREGKRLHAYRFGAP